MIRTTRITIGLLLVNLLSPAVLADDPASMVEARLMAYWDARNDLDHNTVAGLESTSGMLGTNSDGSFHKPISVSTPADWEKNMQGQANVVRVFYPEITPISADVVYARYYLEGLNKNASGASPYRTRVTNVWVKDSDNEWCIKAMHFSPANYGGVHQTQSSDFDD